MINKSENLKKLYEDAIYYHAFHTGKKILRGQLRIQWNEAFF